MRLLLACSTFSVEGGLSNSVTSVFLKSWLVIYGFRSMYDIRGAHG